MVSMQRMLLRNTHATNGLDGLIAFLKTAAALVIGAGRRIGADDQERHARLQAFMADAGRNDYDVPGAYLYGRSLVAAEP